MMEPDPGASTDSLSMNVVRKVAAREGVSVASLERPLFEVVEPDALDALFNSSDGYVTFHYCGYEVRVDASGAVTITEDE
jgi:hypothetical protein